MDREIVESISLKWQFAHLAYHFGSERAVRSLAGSDMEVPTKESQRGSVDRKRVEIPTKLVVMRRELRKP